MSNEVTETTAAPVTDTANVATATPVETKQQSSSPDLKALILDGLAPEDQKMFEKYKDGTSIKNGVIAAMKMVGKKGDIPSEDAPDEVRSEFWNKLGADKIAITPPEFGQEFGDLGAQLKEYYGGVAGKVAEIAKTVIPKSKNVGEMLNGIMAEFIKQDAEASRLKEVEVKQQMEKAFSDVARKTGLSVDELKRTNDEVIKRYGWNDQTSFAEILATLAKETTNSNTMRDAHLNNTNEGIEMQISQLLASDEYLHMEGPAHDLAVAKMRKLCDQLNGLNKNA